jgi:broad specificity phosphatase PhoE
MTFVRVFLVRHGETEWSRESRHTGRTDLPLLEQGKRQARQVGARLAPLRFAMVRTSPLLRAEQTCAGAGLAATAIVDDDLMEWDYGAYEGRRTAEIRAERPGWSLFDDGCPDGETFAEVVARVDRVISEVRDVDGDVVLFAHGHVLRTFATRWLRQGPSLGTALLLDPTTVSILSHERDGPSLELWNDAGHLETT